MPLPAPHGIGLAHMAWNVVVVGGGFGGAAAARHLERVVPRQAARLVLVNDVNFLLYTPFLPEAAAGTLEPRHVVTPLRDMLKRTYLRLGAVTGHDPAARTLQLTSHEDEVDELRYDQLLLALGSVSRLLPVPGWPRTGSGSRALPTRSGSATTSSRPWRRRTPARIRPGARSS